MSQEALHYGVINAAVRTSRGRSEDRKASQKPFSADPRDGGLGSSTGKPRRGPVGDLCTPSPTVRMDGGQEGCGRSGATQQEDAGVNSHNQDAFSAMLGNLDFILRARGNLWETLEKSK